LTELKLLYRSCDGIGPEITVATLGALDTLVSELDLQISFGHELVGFDSHKNMAPRCETSFWRELRQSLMGLY